MYHILLFFIQRAVLVDILIWTLLIVSVVGMSIVLYWQIRQARVLKYELAQLDKIKSHNVEYDFILKAMRLAIWHIDAKTGTITYEKDFRDDDGGFTPPPGTRLTDLVKNYDERDRDLMLTAFHDLSSGKKEEFHEEYRAYSWFSGRTYWAETFATIAERDAEGMPLKLVGASMRIDKRKEMEEALVKARTRAEESDRLKTAFIANISHEIRTPLNAIVGFTSLLPDIPEGEERQELLGLIRENTQKLLCIVDDVVNISKIEAGMIKVTMSTFDLNPLLLQSAQAAESNARPGVKITTEFANEGQMVSTDTNCLSETIQHLLSNATKFTEQGSIVVGYDLPDNGNIRIWVRDTGKGIPDELQQRVFERFFKVDEFVPGAGLGLSVCQAMVGSLGGKIGVESKLGEGSTFWVELPFKREYGE